MPSQESGLNEVIFILLVIFMEKTPLGLLTYKSVYYKNSSKMAPSVMKIITSNTQRPTWK